MNGVDKTCRGGAIGLAAAASLAVSLIPSTARAQYGGYYYGSPYYGYPAPYAYGYAYPYAPTYPAAPAYPPPPPGYQPQPLASADRTQPGGAAYNTRVEAAPLVPPPSQPAAAPASVPTGAVPPAPATSAPSAEIAYTSKPAFINAAGQTCREYKATDARSGRPVDVYGVACRQQDGRWMVVN